MFRTMPKRKSDNSDAENNKKIKMNDSNYKFTSSDFLNNKVRIGDKSL